MITAPSCPAGRRQRRPRRPGRQQVGANSIAERWIGSLRRELLDRTIIWNQRQLHRLVVDDIDHYNRHRPHRALRQRPPPPVEATTGADGSRSDNVIRFPRCDGLINAYKNAA